MPRVAPLQLTLLGQSPSGKNQIRLAVVRGRVMKFPDARFKKWRERSWASARDQRGAWPTLRGPAGVEVRYWPGDLLRRDVPGLMDALCHLLEWCPACKKKNKACDLPLVQDDSLLTDWCWTRMPLDRANPRVEVTITPLEVS